MEPPLLLLEGCSRCRVPHRPSRCDSDGQPPLLLLEPDADHPRDSGGDEAELDAAAAAPRMWMRVRPDGLQVLVGTPAAAPPAAGVHKKICGG